MTAAPEWLTKRDGSLTPGIRPHMVFVVLGGAPQYKVEVRPAGGTYTAAVQQSVNGKRLDDGTTTYSSPDAALAGGLDQLRDRLGW